MPSSHTLRVRASRWEAIEKHAWKLGNKEERYIKPTDIADAALALYAEKVTIEDIERAKKER